jgi:DNA-binding IscR family transcriptional regulator
MLARKPDDISVGEIVETLEGKLAVVDCVLEPELCYRSPECPTREIWVGMTDALKKELFSLSLKDVLRRSIPLEELG